MILHSYCSCRTVEHTKYCGSGCGLVCVKKWLYFTASSVTKEVGGFFFLIEKEVHCP